MNAAITTWLDPVRPVLDPTRRLDWPHLQGFAAALEQAVIEHPVGPDLPPGTERSRRLLAIRAMLVEQGHLNTIGRNPLWQLLAQFVCGYRELDLRDATGLGHGQLIARHATPAARRRWIPRLNAGELAGIAVTEPHGGSRPAATRTRAEPGPDGSWLLTGRKTWISRLTEAAVFVVFFRNPHGKLAAAAVNATQPGLHRQAIPPTGLAGWTWGVLDLDRVPVHPQDVLVGDGMALLRQHFAAYRPLVTATALGAAAAVFDTATDALSAGHMTGDLLRLRDSALVTIGRTHAQITTALLGTVVAAQLAASDDPNAELWGAATKAHGVDVAHQAATELALLLGAPGFRADSQVAKTCRDLRGLLLADGIHDSLYRTAGKRHTVRPDAAVPQPRQGIEAAIATA